MEQFGDIYGTSDTCCRIPANHHVKHLMHKLHCTHLIYCTNCEKVLKMYFMQYFGHIVQNLHKLYKICTNCTKCAHTKICWTSYWTKTKMTNARHLYLFRRSSDTEEMSVDRYLKTDKFGRNAFWQTFEELLLTNMEEMLFDKYDSDALQSLCFQRFNFNLSRVETFAIFLATWNIWGGIWQLINILKGGNF